MSDSNAIRFTCPSCRKRLRVEARLAGKRVRCPNKSCSRPVAVPARSEVENEPIVSTSPRVLVASAENIGPKPRGSFGRSTESRRWHWVWAVGGASVFVVFIGLAIWAVNRGIGQSETSSGSGADKIANSKSPPGATNQKNGHSQKTVPTKPKARGDRKSHRPDGKAAAHPQTPSARTRWVGDWKAVEGPQGWKDSLHLPDNGVASSFFRGRMTAGGTWNLQPADSEIKVRVFDPRGSLV